MAPYCLVNMTFILIHQILNLKYELPLFVFAPLSLNSARVRTFFVRASVLLVFWPVSRLLLPVYASAGQ